MQIYKHDCINLNFNPSKNDELVVVKIGLLGIRFLVVCFDELVVVKICLLENMFPCCLFLKYKLWYNKLNYCINNHNT